MNECHGFNLFEMMSVRETAVQSLTKDLHICTQLTETGRPRKEGDMGGTPKTQEGDIGGTPKTQETYEKFDNFNRRNWIKQSSLKNYVDGTIILKCVLHEQDVSVWTGFNWVRAGYRFLSL
jgi:hypothetical protein